MASGSVLVLSAADVEAVLDPWAALDSQREAFAALGRGTARLAPRVLLDDGDSVAFCYVCRLPGNGAVSKFGAVTPGNAARGLPSVSAVIVALDAVDGRPVAIIEGTSVTTIRTAAASAVAADHLARTDATRLAVIGCGVQGRAHVAAMTQVRPIRHVRMFARHLDVCEEVARRLSRDLAVPVETAGDVQRAVADADIVVTCTTSSDPVLRGAWVPAGCTVVSVGSFAPDRREVDTDLLARASAVVVDEVDTALEQAGPIVDAIRNGVLGSSDLLPLGSVVTGRATVRRAADDVVFYNSVGLGVQDAAAAARVIAAATAQGRGHRIVL